MNKQFNELFLSNKILTELQGEIIKKNEEIDDLKEKLSKSNDNINKLSQVILSQKDQLEKAEARIAELQRKGSNKIIIQEVSYEQQLKKLAEENIIFDLKNQLKQKNEEIRQLQEENSRILKKDYKEQNSLMNTETALTELFRVEEYLNACVKTSIHQFDGYQMCEKQLMGEKMQKSIERMKKMLDGFLLKLKEQAESSLILDTISHGSTSRQPTIRQISVFEYPRNQNDLDNSINTSNSLILFSDMQ